MLSDLKLYNGESWELLIRRWAKLEKDFRMKDGRFEISKIPDIYDCIKYDLQHNQKTLQYDRASELFRCSKALADIVIPQVSSFGAEELFYEIGACRNVQLLKSPDRYSYLLLLLFKIPLNLLYDDFQSHVSRVRMKIIV